MPLPKDPFKLVSVRGPYLITNTADNDIAVLDGSLNIVQRDFQDLGAACKFARILMAKMEKGEIDKRINVLGEQAADEESKARFANIQNNTVVETPETPATPETPTPEAPETPNEDSE